MKTHPTQVLFGLLLILCACQPGFADQVKCDTSVSAFDKNNPGVYIGAFEPGTQLEITGPEHDGKVPVKYAAADGKVVEAWCTTTDLKLSSPPAGSPTKTDTSRWIDNYEKAMKIAKAEKKHVLLDFTGSDWCGWCMKLDKEVFSKSEFKAYAKENLVLVTLDFPQEKQLSASVVKQNKALAEKYKIRGYPTVVVLDPDGKKVGVTGYMEHGPKAFIAELDKITGK